ncbi:hypothetical protein [Lysinibacillus fusiformis]|uniref:hypothetical protein n=1 Tax=Lysinibacillus fusiformis TaxID=28031 RepID=UPI00177BFF2E|nr:hypothetical protein [Lysinibacillus fusiformis]
MGLLVGGGRKLVTEPFQVSYSVAKVGGVVSDNLMKVNEESELPVTRTPKGK